VPGKLLEDSLESQSKSGEEQEISTAKAPSAPRNKFSFAGLAPDKTPEHTAKQKLAIPSGYKKDKWTKGLYEGETEGLS